MKNNRLLYWTAGLAIGALAAHAIDTPDHLNEWWVYGSFFVLAGAGQFVLGLVMLIRPWQYDADGGMRPDAEHYARPYYALGLVLTILVIVVWAISRTTGLPFLGPDANREPFTLLSLIPVLEDIPLAACLAVLLRRSAAVRDAVRSPTL